MPVAEPTPPAVILDSTARPTPGLLFGAGYHTPIALKVPQNTAPQNAPPPPRHEVLPFFFGTYCMKANIAVMRVSIPISSS